MSKERIGLALLIESLIEQGVSKHLLEEIAEYLIPIADVAPGIPKVSDKGGLRLQWRDKKVNKTLLIVFEFASPITVVTLKGMAGSVHNKVRRLAVYPNKYDFQGAFSWFEEVDD